MGHPRRAASQELLTNADVIETEGILGSWCTFLKSVPPRFGWTVQVASSFRMMLPAAAHETCPAFATLRISSSRPVTCSNRTPALSSFLRPVFFCTKFLGSMTPT